MGAIFGLKSAAAAAADFLKSGRIVAQSGKTVTQEFEEVSKGLADVELGVTGSSLNDAAQDLGLNVSPGTDVAQELADDASGLGISLTGDVARTETTTLEQQEQYLVAAGIIQPPANPIALFEGDTAAFADSVVATASDGANFADSEVLSNLAPGVPLSTTPKLPHGPGFVLKTNPAKIGTGLANPSDHGTLLTSLDSNNKLVYTVITTDPGMNTYTAVSSSVLPDFVTSGPNRGSWVFSGPSEQVSGLSQNFYNAATNAPSMLRWMYLKMVQAGKALQDPKTLIILPGGAVASYAGVLRALQAAGLDKQDPSTITNAQWITIYNQLAKDTGVTPLGNPK